MSESNRRIQSAVAALRQGQMIILIDDDTRENEGDLVFAAEFATPENVNFMLRNGGGLVCMPMTKDRADQLQLDLQPLRNKDELQQAPFTVTIDAANGNTTGISAHDRARTIQVAADDHAQPFDLVTPGHIFPLRAAKNGVFERQGHTEGSIDLMRIAGLKPVTVVCEILNEDGQPARTIDLEKFSHKHNIPIVTMRDVIYYRMKHEKLIDEIAVANLPIDNIGEFKIFSFETSLDNNTHLALYKEPINQTETPLVRVHSECLTGDIFGSARCDCGWQLQKSLELLGEQGGILCYLRQEGRGIGLGNKIRAYELQDQGVDTVEANLKLGFAADERDYCIAAQMLKHLNYTSIRLITNNPDKLAGLKNYDINVAERITLQAEPTEANKVYLETKRDKLGHLLQFRSENIG